jgi:hypothetical protein
MTMIRCLAAALLAAVITASPAFASKLYIREYKAITTIGGTYAQIAGEPGADQTPVDFTAGPASSSAVAGSTRFVRLICDASCSYSVTSSAGTATTNNALLPAGVVEFVGIAPGYFINVRSNP